jgi:hypothetical protein
MQLLKARMPVPRDWLPDSISEARDVLGQRIVMQDFGRSEGKPSDRFGQIVRPGHLCSVEENRDQPEIRRSRGFDLASHPVAWIGKSLSAIVARDRKPGRPDQQEHIICITDLLLDPIWEGLSGTDLCRIEEDVPVPELKD